MGLDELRSRGPDAHSCYELRADFAIESGEKMLDNEIIEELALFVSEANRLTSKSFYAFYSNNEVGFSNGTVQENTPDEEQIESYVLHLRKFMQKKDRVSVSKLDKCIRTNFSNRRDIIKKWKQAYSEFNSLLNAQSMIGWTCIPGNEHGPVSLRDIFEAKTYGDLSHLNKAERKLHSELSANPTIEGLYRMDYGDLLFEAGELISEMAKLCEVLLSDKT